MHGAVRRIGMGVADSIYSAWLHEIGVDEGPLQRGAERQIGIWIIDEVKLHAACISEKRARPTHGAQLRGRTDVAAGLSAPVVAAARLVDHNSVCAPRAQRTGAAGFRGCRNRSFRDRASGRGGSGVSNSRPGRRRRRARRRIGTRPCETGPRAPTSRAAAWERGERSRSSRKPRYPRF